MRVFEEERRSADVSRPLRHCGLAEVEKGAATTHLVQEERLPTLVCAAKAGYLPAHIASSRANSRKWFASTKVVPCGD